jgi:cellulose biosynthesis protein BcsQ
MSVIAVYNLKGGVGKTATAVNLAYLAAECGAPTLIWDLDPQGAATYYFRVKPKVQGTVADLLKKKTSLEWYLKGTDYENLDLLPADFSYRHLDVALDRTKSPTHRLARQLSPLRGAYHYVFLDCPPGFSLVTENVFAMADVVLVPVIPTTLSMRTLDQIRSYFERHPGRSGPPELLPFYCMVDRRKNLHRTTSTMGGDGAPGFLNTRIPFASAVERMGLRRAPLPSYDSYTPASRAYLALWNELQEKLAERPGW